MTKKKQPVASSWVSLYMGISIIAMVLLTGAMIYNQRTIHTLRAQIIVLGSQNTALKVTIEQLAESQNKLVEVKPQLTEWVYKHSDISKAMATKIVNTTVDQTSCPLFLLALMKTESNFNPTAVSSKGAMGLGQVMPYHEEALHGAGILVEMRDIFDIETGIMATDFMWNMKMTQANGSIDGALKRYLGAHSEAYVNRILKDYFYLNYLCKKALIQEGAREDSRSQPNAVPKVGESQPSLVSYTVQAGDCLSSIIRGHYGTATEQRILDIAEHNDITDIDLISVGQVIIFPLGG